MQREARRLLEIRWIVQHDPLDDRNRKRAARDEIIVKLSEAEGGAFRFAIAAEELHDLPFADDIADLLRGIGSSAGSFAGRRFAIESAALHEVLHRLIERPDAGVQIHIHADASRAIAR